MTDNKLNYSKGFLAWVNSTGQYHPSRIVRITSSLNQLETFCKNHHIIDGSICEIDDEQLLSRIHEAFFQDAQSKSRVRTQESVLGDFKLYIDYIKFIKKRTLKVRVSGNKLETGFGNGLSGKRPIYTSNFYKLNDVRCTEPLYFTYCGNKYEVSSWKQLYLGVVRLLWKDYNLILRSHINERITGRGGIDFSFAGKAGSMLEPEKIYDNLYVETKLSPTDIVARVQCLIKTCYLEGPKLQVSYVRIGEEVNDSSVQPSNRESIYAQERTKSNSSLGSSSFSSSKSVSADRTTRTIPTGKAATAKRAEEQVAQSVSTKDRVAKAAEADKQEYHGLKTDFAVLQDPDSIEPVTFIYFDDEYKVKGWEELYVKFVKCLMEDYPHILRQCVGKSVIGDGIINFSEAKDSSRLRKPQKITDNFYVEMDLDPVSISCVIIYLLDFCNVDQCELKVIYTKAAENTDVDNQKKLELSKVQETLAKGALENLLVNYHHADNAQPEIMPVINDTEKNSKRAIHNDNKPEAPSQPADPISLLIERVAKLESENLAFESKYLALESKYITLESELHKCLAILNRLESSSPSIPATVSSALTHPDASSELNKAVAEVGATVGESLSEAEEFVPRQTEVKLASHLSEVKAPVLEVSNDTDYNDNQLEIDFTKINDPSYERSLAYTRPCSLSYFGKVYKTNTWRQLYIQAVKYFVQNYLHIIRKYLKSNFSYSKLINLACEEEKVLMEKPVEVGFGLYLEIEHLNVFNVVVRLKSLLDLCHVDYEHLKIIYRRLPNNSQFKLESKAGFDTESEKVDQILKSAEAATATAYNNSSFEIGISSSEEVESAALETQPESNSSEDDKVINELTALILEAELDGINSQELSKQVLCPECKMRKIISNLDNIVELDGKFYHKESFADWDEAVNELEKIMEDLMKRNEQYIPIDRLYDCARGRMSMFLNDNGIDDPKMVYDLAEYLFGKKCFHGKRYHFFGRKHISSVDSKICSMLDLILRYSRQHGGVILEDELDSYFKQLGLNSTPKSFMKLDDANPLFLYYDYKSFIAVESMHIDEAWLNKIRSALNKLFADMGEHVVLRDIEPNWYDLLPELPGYKLRWTAMLLQSIIGCYSKKLGGVRTICPPVKYRKNALHAMIVSGNSPIQTFADVVATWYIDDDITLSKFSVDTLRAMLENRGIIGEDELSSPGRLYQALENDPRFAWNSDNSVVRIVLK